MARLPASHRASLPALTSLRFAAAAMIVVGHAAEQFGAGWLGGIPLNQGVSFFFVLSGFILYYNYPDFSSMEQVGRFIIARVARIWPLHLACLGLFFAVLPRQLWYIPWPTPTLSTLLTFNVLLVQSWIPLKKVVLSLNGVAWSISVEWFFYLAFPVLVHTRAWWRWQLTACLLVVGGTMALVAENGVPLQDGQDLTGLTLLYNNPLVRLLEFLAGILAARAFLATRRHSVSRVWATVAEVAVICAAILALHGTVLAAGWTERLGGLVGVAGFWLLNEGAFPVFALMIVVLARKEGLLAQALAHPVPLFLGEISFALYLVHQIVLRALGAHGAVIAMVPDGLRWAVVWALLLAISAVLHLVVERPARSVILRMVGRRTPAVRLP